MADKDRSYSQEEVTEIIRRALAQQAMSDRVLSHRELVEIAAEAGIGRESLDAATTELAQVRTQALARQSQAAELSAERDIQVKRFGASVVSLGLLNGLLYFIDTQFTGGSWFFWPLAASGASLALQIRSVLFPYDKLRRRKQREQREREKEQRRAAREAWKQRIFGSGGGPAAVAEGAREFENAVQAGLSALLRGVARKIEEHVGRAEERRRGPGGR